MSKRNPENIQDDAPDGGGGLTRRDLLKVSPLLLLSLSGCRTLLGNLFSNDNYDYSCVSPKWDPISKEKNERVLAGSMGMFDPSLVPFLTSIPILKTLPRDVSEDTAMAFSRELPCVSSDTEHIRVSDDWDATRNESKHWKEVYSKHSNDQNEPIFSDGFKISLLVHEFLHLIQVRNGVDVRKFYAAVEEWYLNDFYGSPSRFGRLFGTHLGKNGMKYFIGKTIYRNTLDDYELDDPRWKKMDRNDRYARSSLGVEEFAHIGSQMVTSFHDIAIVGFNDESLNRFLKGAAQDRMLEIPDSIFEFYKGIIHPDILMLRESSALFEPPL